MTEIFTRRPALPPALLLLVAANGLPEIVLSLADLGLVGSPNWRAIAISYGGLWQGLWKDWQPNFAAQPATMLLSYSLLHAGLAHMLGNLATLWVCGDALWRRIGAARLWAVYGAAVLAGGLAFILLSDAPRPVVGASGGIYGLAAAWIHLDWRARRGRDPRALPRAAALMTGLLALNGLSWWATGGNMAWQAHLGGLVGGWVVAWRMTATPQT